MYRLAFPMRQIRAAVVLTLVMFAAATTLTAQQAPDPAGVAGSGVVQTAPAGAIETPRSETGVSPAGPRLTPQFQEYEPSLPGATEEKSLAAAEGRHTIVISTLVLVLAVIIIVLLVAD